MKHMNLKRTAAAAGALVMMMGLVSCGTTTAAPAATETPVAVNVQETAAPMEAQETTAPTASSLSIREILTLEPETELEVNGKTLYYTLDDNGNGTLSYGENSVSLGYEEYSNRSYVALNTDGSFVVYATLGFSGDWYETVPVLVKEGTMTVYEAVDGAVSTPEDITDTDRFLVSTRVGVLGTYGVIKAYLLTEEGAAPESSYMQIVNEVRSEDGSFLNGVDPESITYKVYDAYGRRTLTLKKDLVLHTDRGEVTLSAGTVVWPVGVDTEEGQFFVQYDDVSEGWFQISTSDKGWGTAVDGTDEADCFETLAYAG